MNDGHDQGAPIEPGPPGPSPSAMDLHDAIARHFDGGLDPDAQRALARQLAASPEARRTLASHLRIEAALVRLGLAGLLSGAADPVASVTPTVPPATVEGAPTTGRWRGWRSPVGALAIAGAVLVALVLGPRSPRQPKAMPGGGGIDRVAAQWLRVAREPEPIDDDAIAVVVNDGDDEPGDEPTDEPDEGPPAWLVAAMADEDFQRLSPDAG
jgi:hypothetical protein